MQRLFAFILILLVSPVIVVTCILIFTTTFDRPFFRQMRVGLNRKEFTIYKLRSMKNDRVTFIGRIIRKLGIDELPQLINITLGDMNFVGPRPLTKSDILRLEWNDPSSDIRWSVKPGITGMAQLVSVCDKNVSFSKDIKYIENRSVLLDLKILWRSFLIPIIGKNRAKQLINNT